MAISTRRSSKKGPSPKKSTNPKKKGKGKRANVASKDTNVDAKDAKPAATRELSEAERSQLKAKHAIVTNDFNKNGYQKAGDEKNYTPYEKMVRHTAQEQLWHGCKFINNMEKHMYQATEYVMKLMSPKEHEGLEGKDLEMMQDIWIYEHGDVVRRAINKKRNYVKDGLTKKFIGCTLEVLFPSLP